MDIILRTFQAITVTLSTLLYSTVMCHCLEHTKYNVPELSIRRGKETRWHRRD
jgi:hypothetical protein